MVVLLIRNTVLCSEQVCDVVAITRAQLNSSEAGAVNTGELDRGDPAPETRFLQGRQASFGLKEILEEKKNELSPHSKIPPNFLQSKGALRGADAEEEQGAPVRAGIVRAAR
jgi:hypothetical protein